MYIHDDDPQSKRAASVDTAADRRRPGRPAFVNPQLVGLLRGQIDPDAPPDPVLPKPGRLILDREVILGASVAATLLLAGALMGFAV
jgi:hypothetical protein